MESCPVCLGDYTKKLRPEHVCAYCTKGACLGCIKRYVLGSMSEPHCMHCRRAYSTEILDSLFSRHFRQSELRVHRIKILMEQERSLFPQTLAVIEREDAQTAYMRAHEIHMSLIQRLSPRDTTPVSTDLINSINDIRIKISFLLARVNELGANQSTTKAERREFIRKCPTCADGLLSTAWRCALCKTRACNKCLAVKGVGIEDGAPDPPHTCDPNDIASAKTIEMETKPCPHCGVRVQRSEGCNQMWCTSCNNAFDWRTGHKVNGPVHNPHFHEYQRGNPSRQQWINVCDNNNDPTQWPWLWGGHLVNLISLRLTYSNAVWGQRVTDINRFMIERSVDARAYLQYGPASYEDLRKKRLRRQIDDAGWARLLSARETRRQKENRQRQLDELILAVGRDTFGNIINLQNASIAPPQLDAVLFLPLENARAYYNEQLEAMFKDGEAKRRNVDARWILRYV